MAQHILGRTKGEGAMGSGSRVVNRLSTPFSPPVLRSRRPGYTLDMETKSFSNVADLSSEQRLAVESLVGRPLAVEEMVFLVVMRPGQEPTAEAKARARARLERVFEQVDRHADASGI